MQGLHATDRDWLAPRVSGRSQGTCDPPTRTARNPECATVLAMPHLFTPLREASPLSDWLRRLTAVHDAVARVTAAHQDVVDTVDHWACVVKRRPVDLSGLATDGSISGIIGVTNHPFGELVNQLATVERLLDALR
jgi:hypothetical protein